MVKVALYARACSGDPTDQQDSLASQLTVLLHRVQREDWEVVDVHTDKGSGLDNMQRPGLQKLCEDVRDGKIEAVVVSGMARLSRSLNELTEIRSLFRKHNVQLVCAEPPQGPVYTLTAAEMIQRVADLEHDMISNRVTQSKWMRAQEGYCHRSGWLAPCHSRYLSPPVGPIRT